jgi:molybdate transport system permease protein
LSSLTAAEWGAIALSLRVALTATLFALPVAILTALALARGRFVGKSLLDALVHLPLVLPPVATGYALLLLFGRQGVIGRYLSEIGIVFAFDWTGAALAAAIMAFPLMVRPIRLSIEAIDKDIEAVATTLGARPVMRFLRVTLPLAGPGVAAGAVLGFAKALGEFGATITFVGAIPNESLTLPAAIYAATQSPGSEERALVLCGVAALLAVAAVLVSELLTRWSRRGQR